MLLGENVNGKPVFNGANHNEHGNPHPQYDKFKTWTTKTITTAGEKWFEIFKGTFQKNPDGLSKNDRAFHRLIYSFILYNMNNDAEQDVHLVTFIVQITNSGNILTNVESRQLYGEPTNFKIFYKQTDSTNGIYDVRLYAKSTQAYTKLKILPLVYDPINNYDCPLHLEASYQGINVKDKLDILYSDILNNEWYSITALRDKLSGYTEITSLGDYGNSKVKALSIVNTTSRIRFKNQNEEQLATVYVDDENKSFKFEGSDKCNKYAFDKTLSPYKTDVDLGYADYRFNVGYFHKINIKGYNGYSNLPSTNTLFDTVIYKNPNTSDLYLLVWNGTAWKGVKLGDISFT